MDEIIPQTPSSSSVAIKTTFRPFVSAKQPQKYEPSNIPVNNKLFYITKKRKIAVTIIIINW